MLEPALSPAWKARSAGSSPQPNDIPLPLALGGTTQVCVLNQLPVPRRDKPPSLTGTSGLIICPLNAIFPFLSHFPTPYSVVLSPSKLTTSTQILVSGSASQEAQTFQALHVYTLSRMWRASRLGHKHYQSGKLGLWRQLDLGSSPGTAIYHVYNPKLLMWPLRPFISTSLKWACLWTKWYNTEHS